jgi:hypothetical protein
MPLTNMSMLHVNPGSRMAVLGSDERQGFVVMPVAVTDEGPVVSWYEQRVCGCLRAR